MLTVEWTAARTQLMCRHITQISVVFREYSDLLGQCRRWSCSYTNQTVKDKRNIGSVSQLDQSITGQKKVDLEEGSDLEEENYLTLPGQRWLCCHIL